MSALILALIFWGAAWGLNIWLANGRWHSTPFVRVAVPVIFGMALLVLWEGLSLIHI